MVETSISPTLKPRVFKFTASLSSGQHDRLQEIFYNSAELYNALLESWKGTYKWHQRIHEHDDVKPPSRSYYDEAAMFARMRKEHPFWKDIASNVGRGVLTRFDKTISDFYTRCRTPGRKPGYPRFKSSRRWRSIEIVGAWPHQLRKPLTKKNQSSRWWRLDVKGVPRIRFLDKDGRLEEALQSGQVKSFRLVKTALRVEVHVVVAVPVPEVSEPSNPVGIDPGVKKRFTYHDGTVVEKRKIDRQRQKRLQRRLSRCEKGSNSRAKARSTHAKEWARITEKARNADFRWADGIIKNYDGVAIEISNTAGLLQTKRFSKDLSEQRWGASTGILEYKAEKAGVPFRPVAAKKACTQTCSHCGHKQKMPTDVRVYNCPCGWVCERDRNAALNVYAFGFPELGRPGGGSPGGLRNQNFVSRTSESYVSADRDATTQNGAVTEETCQNDVKSVPNSDVSSSLTSCS